MVVRAPLVAVIVAYLTGFAAAQTRVKLKLYQLPDTIPAANGGRCMDGSMSGYYYRKGVPDTYVIFMHGGGGCTTEATCKSWAKQKGSFNDLQKTQSGDHAGVATDNCATNPYFCNATAAIVPYCTGDAHRGNNTVASAKTWGWIFDGHTSFITIIEELVKTRGLGNAKRILLSGNSAGGIGVFFHLDWLAERFPNVDVKGSPQAGWFVPGALPGDQDPAYPPSDFPHFYAGTHGPAPPGGSSSLITMYNSRGLLPANCQAAQKADQWWACFSINKLYPYVKTSMFVVENQFDTAQIESFVGHIPKKPANASEGHAIDRYVAMYGEAMRNSTAQVLNDAPVTKKRVPDGLFHPSCYDHGVDVGERITPATQSWYILLGDWFFELNEYKQYHRLVERCSSGDLPCNKASNCKYSGHGPIPPTPAPPPTPATTPTPAPPPTPDTPTSCEACENQYCPGEAGKGESCKNCVIAHTGKFEKAGCYVHGGGGRSKFCKAWCGVGV